MSGESPGNQPRLLELAINGESVSVAVRPNETLLEVLRYRLDLIGTKQGCDKGDCGACTVQRNGRPVLSCLLLASACGGDSIDTIEGVARKDSLGLLDAFDRWGAAQCGFCTSGVLMSADELLRTKGRAVTRIEAAEAIAGNLCRCTGYTKIIDAVVEASQTLEDTNP